VKVDGVRVLEVPAGGFERVVDASSCGPFGRFLPGQKRFDPTGWTALV